MSASKLTLVVRSDLSPGTQAVQATHAAVEYLMRYGDNAVPWYQTSNTIALLSVPDEQALF